jgi:hypothetical protein
MVERARKEIRLSQALTAFVIALMLFGMGALLGYIVNYQKADYLEEQNELLRAQVENVQLQLLYMDVIGGNDTCSVLKSQLMKENLNGLNDRLVELGRRLEYYQSARDFGTEFQRLRTTYFLLEIRSWLFYHEIREKCNEDVVEVLYFYSSTACEGCEGEGYILTEFKDMLGDRMLVYSLDVEWSQPIMDTIRSDFNVTSVPALVINGKKYGYLERGEMQKVLCEELVEKPNFCI